MTASELLLVAVVEREIYKVYERLNHGCYLDKCFFSFIRDVYLFYWRR